jgi:hypothetical protein
MFCSSKNLIAPAYTFEPPRKAQVQLILNLNPFFLIGVKITLLLV